MTIQLKNNERGADPYDVYACRFWLFTPNTNLQSRIKQTLLAYQIVVVGCLFVNAGGGGMCYCTVKKT